jgi:hypothetical protein
MVVGALAASMIACSSNVEFAAGVWVEGKDQTMQQYYYIVCIVLSLVYWQLL